MTSPAETVAYGDGQGSLNTYCLTCPRPADVTLPLSVNTVDHWEQCRACGRYLVDVARALPAAVSGPGSSDG